MVLDHWCTGLLMLTEPSISLELSHYVNAPQVLNMGICSISDIRPSSGVFTQYKFSIFLLLYVSRSFILTMEHKLFLKLSWVHNDVPEHLLWKWAK